MGSHISMKYRFESFVFDVDRFELLDERGEVVHPAAALARIAAAAPARRRGRLIDKETDASAKCGAAFTCRAMRSRRRSTNCAKLWEMSSRRTRVIETVRNKGLRLSCGVAIEGHAMIVAEEEQDFADERRAVCHQDQPDRETALDRGSAVSLSSKQEDGLHGLASALPVDIITELARFQLLRVTARASSFMLDRSQVSPLDVKARLGLRLLL